MRSLRVLAATVAAGVALIPAAAAHATPPPAGPKLALPHVTGPWKVGQHTLHLTDPARADPWVPAERRELMVTLWYPARSASSRPARYLTAQESALMVRSFGNPDIPEDLLTKVRTHATVDAPALGGRAPLVILSPGFTLPRETLSAQAEGGYVVAGIGHNYESTAITFPDGHTTECAACAIGDWPKLVTARAADVSFVLDQLTGPRPVWGGGRLIDARRIAMIGHSIGGAATAPAMLADRRIDAGAMLDGAYYLPVTGLDRPFLQFGEPSHAPGAGDDRSWDTEWPRMTGWKRWITVDGGDHNMFTDQLLLIQQAGVEIPGLGIDPLRGIRLSQAYLTAFVDQHLRGGSGRLLDGPSACYSEVRFWHP
ncbi:lipase [Longispora sp. NPDC051575]|uniref:alpha/beta hydrolase family protein n=1 Tax=Longispora sp. NPDC051575 TaxID=3154943 RepID=UPI003449852F